MEDCGWTKQRLDPTLYQSIRAQMLAELQNAYSFYDFMHVEDFLKQSETQTTDIENRAVLSGFDSYIQTRFSDDLGNTDGDAIDDMLSFISKMMTEYGLNISAQYQRVIEAVADRDQRSWDRSDDDYSRFRDERVLEKADEEAISNMFDSLR